MSIEEAPGTRLRRVIREYDALAAEARAGTNRHDLKFYERRARAHRERLDAIATHAPDCPRGRGYSADDSRRCGGTYECPRCDRTFGWCIGAHDDTPALCDECANAIQADAGAA